MLFNLKVWFGFNVLQYEIFYEMNSGFSFRNLPVITYMLNYETVLGSSKLGDATILKKGGRGKSDTLA